MATDDDLPLNVPGNPYDSRFADRIEALGGASGSRPAPDPPRPSAGGGAGWGGGVVALIVIFNLLRGCASMNSSDSNKTYEHRNWSRDNNLVPAKDDHRRMREQFEKADQDLNDLRRGNWPEQEKPAADERGPEQGEKP